MTAPKVWRRRFHLGSKTDPHGPARMAAWMIAAHGHRVMVRGDWARYSVARGAS